MELIGTMTVGAVFSVSMGGGSLRLESERL